MQTHCPLVLCKLQRRNRWVFSGAVICAEQTTLQSLNRHQVDKSVVFGSETEVFFGNRLTVEHLNCSGNFTQLQWFIEDLCENGRQLVSTDFQTGGWNAVGQVLSWSSASERADSQADYRHLHCRELWYKNLRPNEPMVITWVSLSMPSSG